MTEDQCTRLQLLELYQLLMSDKLTKDQKKSIMKVIDRNEQRLKNLTRWFIDMSQELEKRIGYYNKILFPNDD